MYCSPLDFDQGYKRSPSSPRTPRQGLSGRGSSLMICQIILNMFTLLRYAVTFTFVHFSLLLDVNYSLLLHDRTTQIIVIFVQSQSWNHRLRKTGTHLKIPALPSAKRMTSMGAQRLIQKCHRYRRLSFIKYSAIMKIAHTFHSFGAHLSVCS